MHTQRHTHTHTETPTRRHTDTNKTMHTSEPAHVRTQTCKLSLSLSPICRCIQTCKPLARFCGLHLHHDGKERPVFVHRDVAARDEGFDEPHSLRDFVPERWSFSGRKSERQEPLQVLRPRLRRDLCNRRQSAIVGTPTPVWPADAYRKPSQAQAEGEPLLSLSPASVFRRSGSSRWRAASQNDGTHSLLTGIGVLLRNRFSCHPFPLA